MKRIREILREKLEKNLPKNIAHEFQDYGVRLSQALEDEKHRSLYIKLAKEKPRRLLEKAKEFALDYYGAKSKARVFMWRLKELEKVAPFL